LITCRQNKTGLHVVINLKHHVKHLLYVDVGMAPEGLQMIEEQAEWSTPAVMAAKIQSMYLSPDNNEANICSMEGA